MPGERLAHRHSSWGSRLHFCALSPDKDFSVSTWLCIQGKYLLHLALETEVGPSAPISIWLSLYYPHVCLSHLTLASFLSVIQLSVMDACLGAGYRNSGA